MNLVHRPPIHKGRSRTGTGCQSLLNWDGALKSWAQGHHFPAPHLLPTQSPSFLGGSGQVSKEVMSLTASAPSCFAQQRKHLRLGSRHQVPVGFTSWPDQGCHLPPLQSKGIQTYSNKMGASLPSTPTHDVKLSSMVGSPRALSSPPHPSYSKGMGLYQGSFQNPAQEFTAS